MRAFYYLLLLLFLVGCKPTETVREQKKIIATQIPVIEALLEELTKGTEIEVISFASSEMTFDELLSNTKVEEKRLDSLSKDISAVVGLHSIIPDEGLYIAVRNRNIRTVEIDLAISKNLTISSVGTLKKDGQINPYIWLSISNLMQMADLAQSDLSALFPHEATTIDKNHKNLINELQTLKNNYEKKFLTCSRFEAATMDDSFDYFITDVNLFIMNRFKAETAWTLEDKAAYEQAIASGSFKTIIHRWKPLSSVLKPAEDVGITFTILNTGIPKLEHFDEGLIPFMEKNLNSLLKSLEK